VQFGCTELVEGRLTVHKLEKLCPILLRILGQAYTVLADSLLAEDFILERIFGALYSDLRALGRFENPRSYIGKMIFRNGCLCLMDLIFIYNGFFRHCSFFLSWFVRDCSCTTRKLCLHKKRVRFIERLGVLSVLQFSESLSRLLADCELTFIIRLQKENASFFSLFFAFFRLPGG
jgi:hypothetical protein